MQSGLLVKHYSLLAIAIISSCCLFYLVASENAKNTATAQLHQHADADVSTPLPPFEKVNDAAVFAAADVSGRAATIDGIDKKNEKFLRNYKKVKKTIAARQQDIFSCSQSSVANLFIIEEKSDVSPSFNSEVVSEKTADVDKTENLEDTYRKNSINRDNPINRIDDSIMIQLNAAEFKSGNEETHLEEEESLPNIITDIPAVTVTELPLEVLQPMQSSLNAILVEASNKKSNSEDTENRTVDILDTKDDQPQQGDEIIKINDSGGGTVDVDPAPKVIAAISTSESTSNQGSNESATKTTTATSEQQQELENATVESSGTVNLTNEEIPMPVFSEWAQKQMEAAEKQQQAKDQEVVNTIAQKKNLTNGSKKLPPLKMRAKNYASPDCGAKIIASNADATNTGAVLSSSKDEYMLSPCGNRIWFVVELCEAIQAQKVDLANFELFSSSPKNFTVAVSNRFPTRDWSNVGRFVAEDKRNVQSFELHPHLFGKFVRVDIHSHHSQEHFCPVSLFRVFGTSEIEAFETENHPDDDLDDFEDELYAVDHQANAKNSDNIFKSASDAVLSIVKKAAEVLVKPSNNHNRTLNLHTKPATHHHLCRSFVNGEFNCAKCSPSLVQRINNILSCEFHQLENLLASQALRSDLFNTQVCIKNFGVDPKALSNDCSLSPIRQLELDVRRSYYINLLPEEYIGALCYSLTGSLITGSEHISTLTTGDKDNEMALNLTIDKKIKTNDFKTLDDDVSRERIVTKPNKSSNISIPKKEFTESSEHNVQMTTESPSSIIATEANNLDTDQLVRPAEIISQEESVTTPLTQTQDVNPTQPTVALDVNIFNIPVKILEQEPVAESTEMPTNANFEEIVEVPPVNSVEPLPKSDEDAAGNMVWDNLDSLLPTPMPPGSSIGSNQAQNAGAGINLQQKIPGAPQSESIFIRLSNRIKALERNMSLSGQYLEELSRRYKKQVEELQQVLTQQSQTVRSLEEQNRRHSELQELYEQSNVLLKNELDNMALQVHACIVVIIIVGAFVLLLLVVSILSFRAIWHRNKDMQTSTAAVVEKKKDNNETNQKKLPRRKSFDEYSDHGTEKMRRPSEEVTDILKKHLEIPEIHKNGFDKTVQTQPQRKVSVCYSGSPNQFMVSQETVPKSKNSVKRKNAKSSWSNPSDTHQMALERLESMRGMDVTLEEYKKILEAEKYQKENSKTSCQTVNGSAKTKKKLQNFRRQESAPAQYTNNSMKKSKSTPLQNEYNENLILDEEDIDNFIPNSDLVYNEFMPEGPSGYQIILDSNESAADGLHNDKGKEKVGKKKLRRISSPGFFKTSLTKALKSKALGTGNGNAPITSNTPHSSATSWEWHRLKNANLNQNSQLYNSPSSAELLRSSPTGSLDASTLSEIRFPTNSTENSFRILEEAILSSGEVVHSRTAVTNNSKQSHSATSSISGGSNSSQRSSISNSTSSSTTQKKQRGFQRIFRKVF